MGEGREDFWRGRRVLVTGHTGFKGAWLCFWLRRLGADVHGLALAPVTVPSLFELTGLAAEMDSRIGDIREGPALANLMSELQPEVVLHLAAQPLVRVSYRQPLETFATNVLGTANVLEAIRLVGCVRVALIVTTDKVYANREWPYPYRELDTLGGHDPYSASKAAAEVIAASYRDAFLAQRGVAVATARAGNVIGGGDWSEDRLIPDAIRAWSCGQTLHIRRPRARRPWQHVLDSLAGYLTLVQQLWDNPSLAGAYNFGPPTDAAVTVREVIEQARNIYGNSRVHYDNHDTGPHEADWLALETAKARNLLDWRPRWGLAEAIARTMKWYRAHQAGESARKLCKAELNDDYSTS